MSSIDENINKSISGKSDATVNILQQSSTTVPLANLETLNTGHLNQVTPIHREASSESSVDSDTMSKDGERKITVPD